MSPNDNTGRCAERGPRLPRWYALSTRARHEKRVDARLQERGFEVFLPLFPRKRRWHDRQKVILWPLFPGYVFARFTLDALARVLSTPGVATVVRFNGEPVPISDDEIENVRLFAAGLGESGLEPEPTPFVEKGQRVRIIVDPLRNVEGVVVERRGGGRALVQVGLRAIGQALKLDLDAASLQVMEGRP